MKTCSLRLSLYISLQFEIIGFTKNYIVYTGFFFNSYKINDVASLYLHTYECKEIFDLKKNAMFKNEFWWLR